MERTIVSGVFDSLRTAWKTIQALRRDQFPQDKVSVVGPETDEYRAMSGKLDMRQPGRSIVIYGCIGMMLGILLGFYATLTSPADCIAVALGPIYCLLLGAILGTMSGTLVAAMIHCDSTQCDVNREPNRATRGNVVISICVESAVEQRRAQALLREGGPVEIHVTRNKAAGQSSTDIDSPNRTAFRALGN